MAAGLSSISSAGAKAYHHKAVHFLLMVNTNWQASRQILTARSAITLGRDDFGKII